MPLAWLYLDSRTQMDQHQSPVIRLEVGVPQGSVLGLYCSPSTAVQWLTSSPITAFSTTSTLTTQLHLAMRADNRATGLSVVAACTNDVRQWYMQNGLQLSPDKSEALEVGTSQHLRVVTSVVSTVPVASVDLPLADEIKVLGVFLDGRLAFIT